MDPIQQILAQGKGSGGSWDGPFNAFVQGQQLNQGQQRINLQAEQQRLVAQEQGLDIIMKHNQIQRNQQVQAGEAELLQVMIDAGNSPDGWLEESVIQRIRSLSVRNPAVMMSQQGQAALNSWRAADIADKGFRNAKALAEQYKLPLTKVEVTPAGRVDPTFGANDPFAARRADATDKRLALEQTRLALSATSLGVREINTILSALEKGYDVQGLPAVPGTTTTLPGQAPAAPVQGPPAEGQTTVPAPATGVTITPTARQLTTGTVTTIQQAMRNTASSRSAIDRAYKAVEANPQAFTVIGPELAFLEQARSIVTGSTVPLTGARKTADAAAEDIIRGLKQDSQMSLFEKKQLDPLAKVTGRMMSPEIAKTTLNAIRVGINGKYIRDFVALKRPPEMMQEALVAQRENDKFADLSVYDEQELLDAVNKGFISQERGIEAFKALKAQHQ